MSISESLVRREVEAEMFEARSTGFDQQNGD
jgi:hypothetical protein